ncbi:MULTISPECIES: TolC family protein [unclassified Hydrogenobaculum]|uniref:TolC family protein n=1 Tax=unclassified Hydrogenobaculum TaxID=2622382 RepID=UPI0001C51351|nr:MULTISPECIES: TolC family protein [unclassified Hydrogenobaculum]AEF18959.1 outer membrane efflux protein [Hydrogenobaculum sp. 3684]AEG46246.1 outer membrane efflux protein [Hydrogenobaculum sp. SHO]AGG14891.1 outer membrane efflux protein [Hydrogenobaculum sp. HO]AGH93187.1 outer membrane protein [Hydrogenobaculum sp. SN]
MNLKLKIFISGLILSVNGFSLSLKEAIDLSLKHNTFIQKAKNNVYIKEQEHKKAIVSKLGEVDINADTSKFNTPRLLIPFVPKLPLSPSSIPPSAYNLTTLSLSYTIPLFTGFKLLENIKISDLASNIAKYNYKLTKRQIVFNVYSIYINGIILKKDLMAQQQRLKALEKLYQDVSLGVKLGKFAPVDLMKVQYELALTKASIKSIRDDINSVKASLNTLTGLKSIDWHFEPIKYKEEHFGNLEQLINIALKNRYELKVAKENEYIAKRKLFLAKSSYLPNIYFNYTYSKIIGGGAEEPQWSYNLMASVPIFDFGKRYFDILSTHKEYLNTKKDYDQTALDIRKEVVDAYSKLNSAKENLRASQKALAYAEEVMKIEELKYKTGAGDMYDTLLAIANCYNTLADMYKNQYTLYLMQKYMDYVLGEKL